MLRSWRAASGSMVDGSVQTLTGARVPGRRVWLIGISNVEYVGTPDESRYRTTVGRIVKGGQRHFRTVR